MADESTIGNLPAASSLGNLDLIPIEQGGTAKKLQGADLLQYIDANIVSASVTVIPPDQDPSAVYDPVSGELVLYLPASDEIVSCTKTATSGLVDTWTCTTALGETFSFEVTNGAVSLATETPVVSVEGGAVGTSEKAAREDHSHPPYIPSAAQVGALALSGQSVLINFVQDLNDLVSGVGAFQPSTLHSPFSDTWGFVVSGGDSSYTRMQVAYPFAGDRPPKRRDLSGGIWSAWTDVMSSLTAVNGTLPVANGGTGATTAAGALANLGITDSGWIEVTFESGFKNYGTTNRCQYRKVGNVVTVCGAATPVNDIAGSNTQYTMFTLPSGFRPKVVASSIQQGSGNCRWQMQISTTGAVTFSRYADENGAATAAGGSPGAWLVFCMTFLTA
jgi:hypothetical protein